MALGATVGFLGIGQLGTFLEGWQNWPLLISYKMPCRSNKQRVMGAKSEWNLVATDSKHWHWAEIGGCGIALCL